MKSKMIICKRSNKSGGWNVSDEVRVKHERQNRKIRNSIKPIEKPDLDAIMEQAINDKECRPRLP
jgi:hypothetical protein